MSDTSDDKAPDQQTAIKNITQAVRGQAITGGDAIFTQRLQRAEQTDRRARNRRSTDN